MYIEKNFRLQEMYPIVDSLRTILETKTKVSWLNSRVKEAQVLTDY